MREALSAAYDMAIQQMYEAPGGLPIPTGISKSLGFLNFLEALFVPNVLAEIEFP